MREVRPTAIRWERGKNKRGDKSPKNCFFRKKKRKEKTYDLRESRTGVDTGVGADPVRAGGADEASREGGKDDDFTSHWVKVAFGVCFLCALVCDGLESRVFFLIPGGWFFLKDKAKNYGSTDQISANFITSIRTCFFPKRHIVTTSGETTRFSLRGAVKHLTCERWGSEP